MSEQRDSGTLNIVIENLTQAQRMAVCDLLATWNTAGSMGCSRWTGFYADGDGNFRPRVTVNGERPQHQTLVPQERFWTGGKSWSGEYRIDYDAIAWQLIDKESK